MSNDPLAQFRKISQSASLEKPAGDPQQYEAFTIAEGGGRQERLIINRFSGDNRAPAYRYLMDVSTNGKYGTQIVLYYSFMQVRIEGRNMQAGVRALREGSCVSIQEHDAVAYPQPVNPDAPFIEKIDVFMGLEAERARHEGSEQSSGIVLEMDKARAGQRGNGQDSGIER